jgi:hypothetical protein
MEQRNDSSGVDYPPDWDQVADIRVFHTTSNEWERLISWRGDMKRKGWRLLRVTTDNKDITAVFGRTREDLKPGEVR